MNRKEGGKTWSSVTLTQDFRRGTQTRVSLYGYVDRDLNKGYPEQDR